MSIRLHPEAVYYGLAVAEVVVRKGVVVLCRWLTRFP